MPFYRDVLLPACATSRCGTTASSPTAAGSPVLPKAASWRSASARLPAGLESLFRRPRAILHPWTRQTARPSRHTPRWPASVPRWTRCTASGSNASCCSARARAAMRAGLGFRRRGVPPRLQRPLERTPAVGTNHDRHPAGYRCSHFGEALSCRPVQRANDLHGRNSPRRRRNLTPEAERELVTARRHLADARAIAGLDIAYIAAREAYLAAFHAAQGLLYERTGRAAKTHRGLRTEYARLAQTEAGLDQRSPASSQTHTS